MARNLLNKKAIFHPSLVAAALLATLPALATDAVARPMAQRDLVSMARLADASTAPGGHHVAYQVTTPDLATGQSANAIWVIRGDGTGGPVHRADGNTPRWSADGKTLYFLSKGEIWSICGACAAGEARAVTATGGIVDTYRIAPDGQRIVYSASVYPGSEDAVTPGPGDRPSPPPGKNGRLYDQLFARHWMSWEDGRRNHLFAVTLDEKGRAGAPVPLMRGFNGNSPGKPSGGDGDYSISPDGATVVFSARMAGRDETWSTNFDLYSVPIDGSTAPENLTVANQAWDTGPTFSPDGRWLAYRAMKRPGFEADRFGVMLMDRRNGHVREVAPGWDRSARTLSFSSDGRSLYAVALDDRQTRIFRIDIASGSVVPLTDEGRVSGFDVVAAPGGDALVYTADSFDRPTEIFRQNAKDSPLRLTHVTDAALADIDMAPRESFTFSGWNGDEVSGWIFKPAGWVADRRYPVVLLIHGGPQSSWTNSWSPLWNPQVWAGWGYAVVMIDPHGSTGYGQAFTDVVSGHWGDRPLVDLKAGWAAVGQRYPWIDTERACAGGPSYGAYMAFWMAGVWKEPWKCLIAHAGIFDARLMGYSTDELWAYEWENGGTTPWQGPERYEEFNPIRHVGNWTTPMLIVHGEKDYRIPMDQSLGAFTALQRRGIPSQFLYFEDEGHRVTRPVNSLQWHDTVEAWLARWIGPDMKAE